MLRGLVDKVIEKSSHPLASQYDKGFKWLAVFKGGAFDTTDVSVLVDLADFAGVTPEGQSGWITIWVDAGAGLEISSSPFNFGAVKIDISDGDADPKRGYKLAGPSGGLAGIQVDSISMDSPGADGLSVGKWQTGTFFPTVSTISFSANIVRFEVHRDMLRKMLNHLARPLGSATIGEEFKSLPTIILTPIVQPRMTSESKRRLP